jgi:hypothetical protein
MGSIALQPEALSQGAGMKKDGVVIRTIEQVLADQAKQAEAQRMEALAKPVPEGLCPKHADQYRLWGWHDMRQPCKACRDPTAFRSAAE